MPDRYLIDKQREEARRRLRLKERLQDRHTIRLLERTGVGPGWTCLEVGAGAGSIASWLCRRVGDTGRVVAVDLDATFLRELDEPDLEVREQDVARTDLETAAFDLVHTRDLLVHVPERDAVVEKLAGAVRPGGWILLEELDVTTDAADPQAAPDRRALYARVVAGIYDFVRSRGIDPFYGATLASRLERLGFESVQSEGWCRRYRGGPGGDESPHSAAFRELREAVTAAGHVTADDYDAFLAASRDPAFAWREGLTVSTLGRRPAG